MEGRRQGVGQRCAKLSRIRLSDLGPRDTFAVACDLPMGKPCEATEALRTFTPALQAMQIVFSYMACQKCSGFFPSCVELAEVRRDCADPRFGQMRT